MRISEIVDKKISIHCKTNEEADKLCQLLKAKGIRWNSGASLDSTLWYKEKKDMCYKLINTTSRGIRLKYGSLDDHKEYKIMSCDEFLKSNLSILDINHRNIK